MKKILLLMMILGSFHAFSNDSDAGGQVDDPNCKAINGSNNAVKGQNTTTTPKDEVEDADQI